jgi:hypothetical protein
MSFSSVNVKADTIQNVLELTKINLLSACNSFEGVTMNIYEQQNQPIDGIWIDFIWLTFFSTNFFNCQAVMMRFFVFR